MAETPYGTKGSGHSGSETSRERQQEQDGTGVTGFRQQQVVKLLRQWKAHGMTSGELEAKLTVGHGATSAALSVLHKAGHVVRLTERRNRQQVYVLPAFVNGRDEAPHRPRFNVNNLDDGQISELEDAVRHEWNTRLGEPDAKPATLAVQAVLDQIRKWS